MRRVGEDWGLGLLRGGICVFGSRLCGWIIGFIVSLVRYVFDVLVIAV